MRGRCREFAHRKMLLLPSLRHERSDSRQRPLTRRAEPVIGPATSGRTRWRADLSPRGGEAEMQHRSRGAPSRPSHAGYPREQTKSRARSSSDGVDGGIGRHHDHARHQEKKSRNEPGTGAEGTSLTAFQSDFRLASGESRKRNAERRCCVTSMPSRARRGPFGGRSPLGVPPRHLRQRPNATAQLEPRDFLGLVQSARPDGSKDGAHRNARREASRPAPMRHSRALPAPPYPSPARLHPQSGHDAGRACLAQAAREPR